MQPFFIAWELQRRYSTQQIWRNGESNPRHPSLGGEFHTSGHSGPCPCNFLPQLLLLNVGGVAGMMIREWIPHSLRETHQEVTDIENGHRNS